MSDPHEDIAARFRAFADATARGDVEAFKALCVDDVPPETELFLANSDRLREHGWTLRLKEIKQEGDVAEVRFEAVDQDGGAVDEALVILTEEHDGWRVRAL